MKNALAFYPLRRLSNSGTEGLGGAGDADTDELYEESRLGAASSLLTGSSSRIFARRCPRWRTSGYETLKRSGNQHLANSTSEAPTQFAITPSTDD